MMRLGGGGCAVDLRFGTVLLKGDTVSARFLLGKPVRIVILGIGNTLLTDEGVGVR